ncbi:MAG: hypothetical protein AB1696_21850 [Planctomycetota bacterium]
MSTTEIMAQESFERILGTGSPAAAILWTQLCTEHLLNRLIAEKLPNGEAMVSDTRTYSFAIKLVTVRNKDLLPDKLCENIKMLSDLRDRYARGLDYQLQEDDLRFFDPEAADGAPLKLKANVKGGLLKRCWRAAFGRLSREKINQLARIWVDTYEWLRECCKRSLDAE